MHKKTTRRAFITTSAAAAAGLSLSTQGMAAASYQKIIGANDTIRMGFIGVGNRGTQLLRTFMKQPDVTVAALCDVYRPYITRDRSQVHARYLKELSGQVPDMGETFSAPPTQYEDYRALLENKEIDAVCIATPDHWHALQTIDAISAGKDIYVEKPLTNTLYEGRKMIEAGDSSKQVVAVGLNRRGSSVYQKLAQEIPAGKIGKVTVATAARVSNMYPDGIGRYQPEEPPQDFNWDQWLGPRAFRPYQYNIAPYRFRWWEEYSSQMGNWGVHYMDVIRWMMGEQAPSAITASGGKYVLTDDRTIPDTMQVIFEFASGAVVNFAIYEASSGGVVPQAEVQLRGTQGTLYASEKGYRIEPTHPGQFQEWEQLMEAETYDGNNEMLGDGSSMSSTATLIRNFLDCVKTRQTPLCTLEEGHRSTSFAHLANIALKMQTRLEWDAEHEKFTNHRDANNLLRYQYRKPWKL